MSDALIRVVLQGDEAVAGADRVSQALTRMERSEPSYALRSTRRAIDELASSASGLHPALGRVLAQFAQLGIGGPVGLGAVAGLAVIGLEMKALIGQADALDAKMLKLNTTLATGRGAGAATLFAAESANLKALETRHDAGFVEKLTLYSGLPGVTDIGVSRLVGRITEAATEEQLALTKLVEFHHQHTAILTTELHAEDERTKTLIGAELAVAKARGAGAGEIERLTALEDHYAVALGKGDLAFQTRLEGLHTEARLLEVVGQVAKELAGVLPQIQADVRALPTRLDFVTSKAGAPLLTDAMLKEMTSFPGVVGLGGGRTLAGPKGDLSQVLKEGSVAGPGPGGGRRVDALRIAMGSVGLLEGLGGGRDFGQTLSSLGAVGMGLPGLQIPGAVATGLGALLHFGGGSQKVTIAEIEANALTKLRELGATIMSNFSVTIVDSQGNVRQTQFALDNAARRDQITRLPFRVT